MSSLQGLLGLAVILGLAFALCDDRRAIPWRTVVAGLAVQVLFALLVLRVSVGRDVLDFVSGQVAALIAYTEQGTDFVFGPLTTVGGSNASIFAFQVLPVIVFLGALIALLQYLRIIQFAVHYLGTAIGKVLGTSPLESTYAAVVVFLGQTEAPLAIGPYLKRLSRSELFTVMGAGFASVAGSTLVGYTLLGAPLPYLLAASVMNAPGALLITKMLRPPKADDPSSSEGFDVRTVRDEESANVIDAVGRGALNGGRIAVTVGALLIAFVALIGLANGLLGGAGGWFGIDDLTFQRVVGWIFAPVAWLIGVPWSEAARAGSFIGQKTVVNEFVGFSALGPEIRSLDPKTVLVSTFALAGFANLASIAIQIGTLGGLAPERRAEVARLGLLALLAGVLVNLSNAAIAGVVAGV